MEKVWRKVNQGLSSTKTYKTDTTDSTAGFGEETNVVAIAEQKLKHNIKNVNLIENRYSKPKRRRRGNARKNITKKEIPDDSNTNELSLREKAVARFKLFNFNLNWDLQMSQCKPCGSKPGNILTRRLYRNKRQNNDNELYRSNSFKFERFERKEDIDNTTDVERRKISICDDYSLPIDFLKKRPASFDPSLSTRLSNDWNCSTPLSHQSDHHKSKVKFIEGYSQPKDTKKLFETTVKKNPISPIKDAQEASAIQSFQFYSDSSQPRSSGNESEHKVHSADSVSDDFVNFPKLCEKDTKPSPYYYSDIAKHQSKEKPIVPLSSNLNKKKEKSFKQILSSSRKSDLLIAKEKTQFLCNGSSGSLTSEDSDCSECKNLRNWHAQALANVQATCNISVELKKQQSHSVDPEQIDILFTQQAIFGPSKDINLHESSNWSLDDNSEVVLNTEDMSNSVREVYETAFDSVITSKDDEINMIDNITKNPGLFPFPSDQLMISTPQETIKSQLSKQKKESANQATQEADTDDISGKMQILLIKEEVNTGKHYGTPSPPSTAPLPLKFPIKNEDFYRSSIKSTPNLPNSNAIQHPRLMSLRSHTTETPKVQQSCSNFIQESSFKKYNEGERPHSVIGVSRLNQLKCIQRKFKNFPSTDSIRSSNNSIDSIRSSTSDGARSTSSSESRRSSSISSHDSDSGTNIIYPLKNYALNTKLHILSPISDKSVQEPDVDLFKNWDSAKLCPITSNIAGNEINENYEVEFKKISASNKLVSSLASQEMRGSDSGISLQSRDETKSKILFNNVESTVEADLLHGLKDLPFDMPKLRRRKIPTMNEINTSGNATSDELSELPMNMPKLNQREDFSEPECIKPNLIDPILFDDCPRMLTAGMINEDKDLQRQSLTLNFNERKEQKSLKFGTLDGQSGSKNKMFNLGLNKYNYTSNLIDVETPFDRQNWYHGAISRIEAENILRPLVEGSFLVRNSESTKQDYSLSLKSAKGFMHMRIQKSGDSNKYILGQYSRPFDTIPEMIQHFCLNRLPVRGAEHMCLVEPVNVQIL